MYWVKLTSHVAGSQILVNLAWATALVECSDHTLIKMRDDAMVLVSERPEDIVRQRPLL